MPKLFQINVTANWGSHGKIAEDIGRLAIDDGWSCTMAYGRGPQNSSMGLIKIGNKLDTYIHFIKSTLFDNQGLNSESATRKLIKQIVKESPDIIHLHNIHGHYINYPILFDFLRDIDSPVVWTLHDCWSFTGHCTHFEFNRCFKWRDGCYGCNFKKVYPSSVLFERSMRNYEQKKEYFTSLRNLTLIPVSNWLACYLKESFFKENKIRVIHNGIDLDIFKPVEKRKIGPYIEILGVASNWRMRKGFPDFLELSKLLPNNYHITLIGLSKKEISLLPNGVTGVERTNNVRELVDYYNKADIFVNLTYEDNYPTTNLEAMACGTPVLTYNTGGSPEAVTNETGWVVEQGNIKKVADIIISFPVYTSQLRKTCRIRAEENFDKNKCFEEYIRLYNELLLG